MYLLVEVPPEFGRLDARCKEILEKIASKVKPDHASVMVEGGSRIIRDSAGAGKLLLLRDGTISYLTNGKFVCFFETGDLVGLEEQYWSASSEMKTEFAVVVDEYKKETLLRQISTDPLLQADWLEYLGLRMAMYHLLSVAVMRTDSETPPEIRSFQAGDVIIQQDSMGEEVFTLVEGHADVFVDGVRVGDVLADEIFGTLGALTGTPRTASVVATRPSMVLTLKKENFIDLFSVRPTTSIKLVEDMARTIIALNKEVVSHKTGKI